MATADERIVARARYVRVSPRKARQITKAITGKRASEAAEWLRVVPKKAARLVEKTLRSAMANAENNHNLSVDELRIARAYVDQGPILYRFRPRAFSRAAKIRKRSAHITIELKGEGE